jgi:prolycopene isomerase
MKDFDVIVIGSGIGGLTSAGILASQGLKTLVLERHRTPGGYLSSFKRKGFVFDSAVDCISGVAPGGLIYRVLELLDVAGDIDFIRIDPVRVSIFPDFEVSVDADLDAYIERLRVLFPSESSGIRGLFKKSGSIYDELQSALDAIISGRWEQNRITPGILRLMDSSYEDLLSEHLVDSRLKAVLSDRCPFIGLPPSGVSALAMVNIIMSYFRLGAYRATGGFQRLADGMTEGIKKKGGSVILGNGAKQIILDKHEHCIGIRCDNDEEITARYVVSNADFNQTFSSLLGGRYSSVAKNMLCKPGISTSFFVVYAGIRGTVGKHSSVGHFPSYEMDRFFEPGMEFKDENTIGITIASIEDASRAPAGSSTVVLHEMTMPSEKVPEKAVCIEKILRKAENIFPGIRDRIEVLDAATAQTLQRYTGNHRGAAFGWRQIPGFRGTARHGIKNLYIAGHWGDMGGGVLAAAYSGVRAAGEILAREGLKGVF